ncbi:MAG: serine/threonine protein kinase, partial [Myxococcaceae bacterium]|nr:serine/threonine protein kinase [Myxococcaceae bacterium]
MSTRVAPRPAATVESPAAGVLSAGARLGRYELLARIASGGMAEVWAAEQAGDLGFRKLVALKTIRPEYAHDAAFRAMFLDEARLASRIRHVNVVEVLDLGIEGTIVFQAMTLIEGAALSGWFRALEGGKRLPLGVGLRIVLDVLHGLHAAHELADDDGIRLGLVHRDVSPQNVLLGVDGVAKLADFGIAKAFGRTSEETLSGGVKGKIGYLAPEQLAGSVSSARSDIFAVGVLFWEILTGRRLFELPTGEGALAVRRLAPMRDPRDIVPAISPSLAAVAMQALASDPEARFASAAAMADAIEAIARAEGTLATQRDVAARLAADLGPEIQRQRDRIRSHRQSNSTAPPPIVSDVATETVTSTEVGAPPAAPLAETPPRPRAWYAGALLAALAGVLGVVAFVRHQPS